MPTRILGEFENLFKCFNNTNALDGLSFKLYKGINALIGPNGSGKTTPIKLSLGLIRVDSGKANLFGFDCWHESLQVRRKIGVLFEKVAYYDNLTGLEHLELFAKLKGVSNPTTECKEVLNLVELDKAAYSRKIKGYSAGMRQRIGIAHALLGKPELVFLDEPTSNLDPLGRARIIEIIKTIKKEEGISFLISSHILPELEKVCEHVILIHNGKAIRQGPLEQLLHEIESQVFMIKVSPTELLIKLLKTETSIKKVYLKDDVVIAEVIDANVFKKRLLFCFSSCVPEEVNVRQRLRIVFRMVFWRLNLIHCTERRVKEFWSNNLHGTRFIFLHVCCQPLHLV
jgi:ABC-2 type transport system ATP-binding protein